MFSSLLLNDIKHHYRSAGRLFPYDWHPNVKSVTCANYSDRRSAIEAQSVMRTFFGEFFKKKESETEQTTLPILRTSVKL